MAGLLGRHLDAVVINHDLIKSYLLENGISFGEAGRLAYGMDWTLADDLVRQGRSVVVDSTCFYQEVLDRGRELVGRAGEGWEWWYVECKVGDVDVLDERLKERAREQGGGLMRCQRTGVQEGPVDVDGGDDGRRLFERWIEHPCRPDPRDEWVKGVVVFDATKSPGEALAAFFKQVGWASSEVEDKR
jgi:hypothetical protein